MADPLTGFRFHTLGVLEYTRMNDHGGIPGTDLDPDRINVHTLCSGTARKRRPKIKSRRGCTGLLFSFHFYFIVVGQTRLKFLDPASPPLHSILPNHIIISSPPCRLLLLSATGTWPALPRPRTTTSLLRPRLLQLQPAKSQSPHCP